VKSATEAYLADEDAVALWLADRCEISPRAEAGTAALFGSWLEWCDKAGEIAGNQKAFVQTLENRGFVRTRIAPKQIRGFRGLRLCTLGNSDSAWRDDVA
jgi:putative DNA primase/helicase